MNDDRKTLFCWIDDLKMRFVWLVFDMTAPIIRAVASLMIRVLNVFDRV